MPPISTTSIWTYSAIKSRTLWKWAWQLSSKIYGGDFLPFNLKVQHNPGNRARRPPMAGAASEDRTMTRTEALADLRSQLRDAITRGWQFTASMLRRDIRDLLAREG